MRARNGAAHGAAVFPVLAFFEIEDLIRSLREQGRTSILLVEQYLDFALNVGNYFYVMETGTIVMHGATAEFDSAAAREYLAV